MPANAVLADRPPAPPPTPMPPDFGATPLLTPAVKPPQDAASTTADVLCEVSLQGFPQAIARNQAPPIGTPGIATNLVAVTLPGVELRRTLAPLLTMTEDVTQTLPVANGMPPR